CFCRHACDKGQLHVSRCPVAALLEENFVVTAVLIVVRAVHITASFLIAGSFTFNLIANGIRRAPDKGSPVEGQVLVRWTIWSLLAAALSGVLWFWLEVINMTGVPLWGAFSLGAWRTVLLNTKFGHLWSFRLGIGIAIAFGISRNVQNE